MSMDNANTPAPVLEQIANAENGAVRAFDAEDTIVAPTPGDDDTTPAVPPAKGDEKVADRRTQAIEEIATQSRQREREELEETNSRLGRGEPEPAFVDPEARVVLKVRGENIGMTSRERDELAGNAFGGDVADLSPKERDKYAQMELANRHYERQLADLRKEIKDTRAPQQAQPQATAAPVETPKGETPDEKRERALEIVQLGGDKTEANRLLKEANAEELELAFAAREDRQKADTISAAIDRNYAEGRSKAEEQYGEALSDPVVRGAVEMVSGGIQATIIAQHISGLDETSQMAFQESGITPAYLQSIKPDQAAALYRDMISKGYRLPPPGPAYVVAAKVVTERLSGATPPNAVQHPGTVDLNQPDPVVDRSGRKTGLTQPERASLPRQGSTRQSAPPSERERASRGFEEIAASRRGGLPVR